jgi:succinoglycan biosynthesis protein ExoM
LRKDSEKRPEIPIRVTVCACTYRRMDGLEALLGGLEAQDFDTIPVPRIDIVIVDNEGNPNARQLCSDFQDRTSIPLTYVHESRRGISHARNACLDHVPPSSEFFAMIDDDEVPDPDWLEQLLRSQSRTRADVVLGEVVPVFSAEAPAWIKQGHFFGSPRPSGRGGHDWKDGQDITTAATNNVLVRCSTYRELNLRFDTSVNLSGGEDDIFFRDLHDAGFRIVFSPSAKVRETIPPHRATLGYLVSVEYRIGNNKLPRKLSRPKADASRLRPVRVVLKSMVRDCAIVASGLGWIIGSLLSGRTGMDRLAVGILRMALGVGGLIGALGIKREHYR